ncbi:hypothetical protein C8R43DRAFT_1130366 [Mycena crocata]|nr:hypothetical protein C8R43DRAFT_1130366 [Mycena crocata]
MSKRSDDQATVVIVGDGGAGIPHHSSTQRTFHVHLPALPRMVVTSEGNLEDSAFMPYDGLFAHDSNVNSTDMHGTVEAIESHKIYFVRAGPIVLPLAKDEALRAIADWRVRIKDAESVVLVRGGVVGIELAGEIKDHYPEKPVTIVHNGEQLANAAYPAGFRKKLAASLRRHGVQDNSEDQIDSISDGFEVTVTIRRGVTLKYSLVLATRGGHLCGLSL